MLIFLTLPTVYILSLFFSKEISFFDNFLNASTQKALADTTSGSEGVYGQSGDGEGGCEAAEGCGF
jgi:hypothetical protein